MNINELAKKAAELAASHPVSGELGSTILNMGNTGGAVPGAKPEPGKDVDQKPAQLQEGLTQMLNTTEQPQTDLLRE